MEEHIHDENKQEEHEKVSKKDYEKKTKNLVSIIILLAGLFFGSLFVDVVQALKGSGYSAKNLNKAEIFEANGKTWVAYSEPAVKATVINDDSCENCDVSEVLVWLRRVLPTVSTEKVAFDSAEGKKMIETYGIKTLPALIFSPDIEKTDFYSQASVIFNKKDDNYVLNTSQLGIPAGKFLSSPEVNDSDASFGNKDSNVKVVVFSDFQCPYCKVFYQGLREAMKQSGDKAFFVYKHFPLDIHPQAENAALASSCAQEQGKFWEYSDKLYQNQAAWGSAKDTSKFKEYARVLGLDAKKFNDCLDSKKYQDQINADKAEADDYGLSGTPAVFVNDQFQNGALTADQLKKMIDDQVNK